MKIVYWIIVACIIVIGDRILKDEEDRKRYVILMALLHIFVCGFRYEFLSGDLIKYNTTFRHLRGVRYTSNAIINGWRNTGFYATMKFFGDISNGNYQFFLFSLSVITISITSYMIYRYSVKPWLSFLVFNCMNFYLLYDFIAIKQGLAMSLIMIALMCILEDRFILFVIFTLLAGLVHMPALVFLPAYFVAFKKVDGYLILIYIAAAVIIFNFRVNLVDMFTDFYYEDHQFYLTKEGIGGKVIVVLLIIITGLLLKGFREVRFSKLFNIIVIAAIIQMFSVFNNVFTRLADYYLQFTILFIPDIFYQDEESEINMEVDSPYLSFTDSSTRIIVFALVLILIWWYNRTCLGITIENEADNYLNYRFMWQVK